MINSSANAIHSIYNTDYAFNNMYTVEIFNSQNESALQTYNSQLANVENEYNAARNASYLADNNLATSREIRKFRIKKKNDVVVQQTSNGRIPLSQLPSTEAIASAVTDINDANNTVREASAKSKEAAAILEEKTKELQDLIEAGPEWIDADTVVLNNYLKYNAPSVQVNGENLTLERNPVTLKFRLPSSGRAYERADILSITWRESDDYRVKTYHENWISLFYDRSTDQYRSCEDPDEEGLYRTIRIKLGNKKALKFNRVLPKNVAGLNLSWGNNPSIITHSMEYYIESWEWEDIEEAHL